MNQHKVVKILGQPEEMKIRLDHLIVKYWGVPVILEHNNKRHESIVTYDTQMEAQKLQVEDVFLR